MNYHYVKRIFDVIFSIVLIVALCPVLLIISTIIKVVCPGPIIFTQERLGRNGRSFKILKFRSMKTNAPNIAAKDINNEEYVTKFGKLLRKTSLDELPQLFNILKGDMSFVGPRPFILNEGDINIARRELGIDLLRPGLTGWAQVNARDTKDQNVKLALDLFYKDNISLILDIKTILYTFNSLSGK